MFDIRADQKFLWVADYGDIVDCEYVNGKWKRFDDIVKSQLVSFGLCSKNNLVCFDANTGAFHLGEVKLEIFYGEYNLTDMGRCDDIIQYKSAHTNYRKDSVTPVYTDAFSYGYKKKVTIDDIEFSLKFIHSLPGGVHGNEILAIQIVANRNMCSNLVVRQTHNDVVSENSFYAPLKADHAGKLNLVINSQGGF